MIRDAHSCGTSSTATCSWPWGQSSSAGLFLPPVHQRPVLGPCSTPASDRKPPLADPISRAKAEDFDVIKIGRGRGRGQGNTQYGLFATDGNLDAWEQVVEGLQGSGVETNAAYQKILGNDPDGTRNPDYEVLLDPENLIDYMLVIFLRRQTSMRPSPPSGRTVPPTTGTASATATAGRAFGITCGMPSTRS